MSSLNKIRTSPSFKLLVLLKVAWIDWMVIDLILRFEITWVFLYRSIKRLIKILELELCLMTSIRPFCLDYNMTDETLWLYIICDFWIGVPCEPLCKFKNGPCMGVFNELVWNMLFATWNKTLRKWLFLSNHVFNSKFSIMNE